MPSCTLIKKGDQCSCHTEPFCFPLNNFFRIPGKTYMIIAFLTVGTMGLSNTSLGYLNYPTQVIFKCCKLIPVMIGGVFIQGKWQRRSVSEKMSAAAHRVLCSSLSKYWIVMIKRFFLYKWGGHPGKEERHFFPLTLFFFFSQSHSLSLLLHWWRNVFSIAEVLQRCNLQLVSW